MYNIYIYNIYIYNIYNNIIYDNLILVVYGLTKEIVTAIMMYLI